MSAKWSYGMEAAVRAAIAGKPVRDAAMELRLERRAGGGLLERPAAAAPGRAPGGPLELRRGELDGAHP